MTELREKFRRALDKLLYAHGEWAQAPVLGDQSRREQLADVACAAEVEVIALYDFAALPVGPTLPAALALGLTMAELADALDDVLEKTAWEGKGKHIAPALLAALKSRSRPALPAPPLESWHKHECQGSTKDPKAHDPCFCVCGAVSNDRGKTWAALPAPEPPESWWLIERGHAEGQRPTIWWTGGEEFDGGKSLYPWTEDANKAMRFSRKASAQQAIDERSGIAGVHTPFGRATEHVWIGALPAEHAPPDWRALAELLIHWGELDDTDPALFEGDVEWANALAKWLTLKGVTTA